MLKDESLTATVFHRHKCSLIQQYDFDQAKTASHACVIYQTLPPYRLSLKLTQLVRDRFWPNQQLVTPPRRALISSAQIYVYHDITNRCHHLSGKSPNHAYPARFLPAQYNTPPPFASATPSSSRQKSGTVSIYRDGQSPQFVAQLVQHQIPPVIGRRLFSPTVRQYLVQFVQQLSGLTRVGLFRLLAILASVFIPLWHVLINTLFLG